MVNRIFFSRHFPLLFHLSEDCLQCLVNDLLSITTKLLYQSHCFSALYLLHCKVMWLRKIDPFSFLLQWLGSDPNYDCTIRVANLDLRDSGKWVCEIGSSTKESFQVQTKEFVIDIESE